MKTTSAPFRVFSVLLSLTLVTGFVYCRSGGNLLAALGLEKTAVAADRDAEVEQLKRRVAELEAALARLTPERIAPSSSEKPSPSKPPDLMPGPKSAPVVLFNGSQKSVQESAPPKQPTTTKLLPGSKPKAVLEPQDITPVQKVDVTPNKPRVVLPGSKSAIVLDPESITPKPAQAQQADIAKPSSSSKTKPAKKANQPNASPTKLLPGSKSDGVFRPRDVQQQAVESSSPAASGYSRTPRP
jgi:hypothetical protein